MKKSIADKIEQLLQSMTDTENRSDLTEDQSNIGKENAFSAKNIGKFCRMIPISIFNLIRPAKTYDLK